MNRIADIIEHIRTAQTAGRPESGGGESFDIVFETRTHLVPAALESAVAAVLPVELAVAPLFPAAGAGDADLGRFYRLHVPGLDLAVLPSSPFDLAYHLKDALDLVSAEPDLETEFYREPAADQGPGTGPEFLGDILNCWVEKDAPADRAWALRNMRVPQAWAFSQQHGRADQGRGIVIGQPDTGVAEHAELTGALDFTRAADLLDGDRDPTDPLDPEGPMANPGHGTATASVAVSRGAVLPDPRGGPGDLVGTAPKAMLTPIRCIESVVRISQSRVAQAIDHARRQGCHVVTMSLGGLPSAALKAALRRAVDENMIVLAAAGNCVGWVVWPAAYDRCIAVGGTNVEDRPWKGSCHGPQVDVSAPAELVWRASRQKGDRSTTTISGGQGTSFAVALTAGVAALWLAHHGRSALIASLGPGERLQDRFRRLVMQTARRPVNWTDGELGAGIVDAEALLRHGPGAPGGAGPEMVHLGTSDTAAIARILTEAAVDAPARPRPEAAFGLGLSPAELERYGVELAWLAFKQRVAKQVPRISAQAGTETATAPAAEPSGELSAVLARPGAEPLAAALGR